MNPSISQNTQKDLVIYGLAVALAFAITFVNYQEKPKQQVQVDQAIEQLLNRVDSTSALLSTWGKIDINQ